jgi:hypothetical protein
MNIIGPFRRVTSNAALSANRGLADGALVDLSVSSTNPFGKARIVKAVAATEEHYWLPIRTQPYFLSRVIGNCVGFRFMDKRDWEAF